MYTHLPPFLEHSTDGSSSLNAQFSLALTSDLQQHRDHVPEVPPDFQLLGSTSKCPVQGMLQYYPSSQRVHILCVQGHPEFSPRIVNYIIDARSASGVFNSEVTEEARRRAGYKQGGEGRGVIGWGVWKVLLQDCKV